MGAVAAVPIKPTRRRVRPARFDADLDGPVDLASPRRPIAARLVGILGPIGLATFLAAGYACALKINTNVSPLEDGAIRVRAGLLAFFLIAIWPTFGHEAHG